jgi:hypothetical protein
MTPREERRFRLVWVVGIPFGALIGLIASLDNWSVGWIWLAVLSFVTVAVVFVHGRPRDWSRRR